jgi:hypothetical protein
MRIAEKASFLFFLNWKKNVRWSVAENTDENKLTTADANPFNFKGQP